MTTVTITIDNVLKDMRIKSSIEAARIADPDLRYAVEMGTDKDNEVRQCLQEAHASLVGRVRRFLAESPDAAGSDDLLRGESYEYKFDITSRRSSNIGVPLADGIHSYLVSRTMQKYYLSTGQTEQAAARGAEAERSAAEVERILTTKLTPLYGNN